MGVRSLLLPWTLVALLATVCSAESAWHGHTTAGSTKVSRFTPYYVPPGAKSYDSSSPLLHYTGDWSESFSSKYVQKSARVSKTSGAGVSFTYTGTGVEWFGSLGPKRGIAQVYLDGKLAERVDMFNNVSMSQQRIFWSLDLPQGKHTLKIVNTGEKSSESKGTVMDVDALVVTQGPPPPEALTQQNMAVSYSEMPSYPPLLDMSSKFIPEDEWTLIQNGSTGVHAMQLVIISDTHALIVDKVEHNPLTVSGHPAWAALYNLRTHALKPLPMQSNSFCAGGTFLSNGTLVNVGGNPVVEDHTAAADFGDVDGLQAIRIFEPCEAANVDDCWIYENHSRIRMASPRWYNTVLRISDGSAMIIGGSLKGGWINNQTTNNPTIEYFPPKNIAGSDGLPVHLPFLVDTLFSNLFPIAFSLPDGTVFMAANRDAMIYDWKTNTERRLPRIPNGVRVTYPMTGTGLLLPLSPENDYTPEILLCGGSTIDDTKPGYEISSQDPASSQCSRIVLTDAGIAAGWQVEQMPQARTMPDAVLLPTGDVLIVNGAGSGISGYGNVVDQVGASNADNPVLTPVLYDPNGPVGQRFSSAGMPSSDIPRLYHSVATLTPNGDIMIAGSNPNLDRSEVKYGTEYRVEWLGPSYLKKERPQILGGVPKLLGFGKAAQLKIRLPSTTAQGASIKVALMDLGYVTHAVHANSRLVYLEHSLSSDSSMLTITAPPNGNIYPPGPGFIYVVVDGVPSTGARLLIGDGQSPPVDQQALENMLEQTSVDQYEKSKGKSGEDDSE
ncbi:copper radical oxidase [Polyporus arcularius HHB13444]|uniref:Copper radical oxidase n=1 Tax=Polyporus arcularius HHB13444 TaxID=1314778 RepID=A0A5C3Q1L0_9APHY|nr:copper radical oxidase [Polyporus arcularius HHB13444]